MLNAPRLLVVDDDEVYRERLGVALRSRGYRVSTASGVEDALAAIAEEPFDRAVLDLRLGGRRSGLELLPALRGANPEIRAVVLTGYGSIPTAVDAIRLGAADYLAKPADADAIMAALESDARPPAIPETGVPSLDRVEWEHLQRVLADCGGNISQAARLLGIERRSLQRRLKKFPPPK